MVIFGKSGKRYLRITSGLFLVIALAMLLAMILPGHEKVFDFITLYAANFAILHRVPLYDTSTLTRLMIVQFNLKPDFTLFPHPYPPWFALSTFFLALLPPKQAANAWMLLNATMLLTCAILLTQKWKPIPRILAMLAVPIFVPSIGLMVVGQYSTLVLLGATLFLYAAQREDAPLTALGLLLITFKPHLGLFLFPAGFFWLTFRKTPFAQRALWLTIIGGVLLAALGFIADPAWPVTYIHALREYTTIQGVSDLGLSAGFSAMLVKIVFGQGSAAWATGLSLLLIVIMLVLFWRFKIYTNLETLIAACILLTLLGDPYLLNYDYILILLPLGYLLGQVKNIFHRISLGIVYFIPWFSLILERNANILYAFSAIFLLVFLIQKSRSDQKLVSNSLLHF
jgi:hypothetical protein